jgi:DDE_Tnp_1-associated/Transposase DDE domain
VQPAPAGSLLTFLSQVPDPRGLQGRRHPLEAMLASVVCAMLQGARGYAAIAEWVHLQEVEFWHALGYTRIPPREGAFRKLLMAISPVHFERVLADWVKDCLGESAKDSLQAVAMDGKTLCGTLRTHERAVHLLALLDQRTGCVLSQTRVDEKTNEHKAALDLLKALVLEGRVITGDAMFCQRDVCQEIRDRGGHYFFVVKDNQPTLKESIAAEFRAAFSPCKRTAARVPLGRGGNLREAKRADRTSPIASQHPPGRTQRLA